VRFIVDANIVFSAILNSNSKIGKILMLPNKDITFIAPFFLKTEIHKHHSKLSRISGLSLAQIQEAEFYVYKNIKFISEEQIRADIWLEAEDLVRDIDHNDVPYVAFAKHFKCKIWSGDKKLIKGLRSKGINFIIDTTQVSELLQT